MGPWRRNGVVIPAAIILAIVIVAAFAVWTVLRAHGPSSPPAASPPASASSAAPSARRPALVTLPFTGLNHPTGVAVDTAGNVYVTDTSPGRVLKLAPGAATPTELPFTG